MRSQLTYANVMSTVAVFVALGGGAYAAATIDSGDVVNESLKSVDVKNNQLKSEDVLDDSLGAVDLGNDAVGAGELQFNSVGPGQVSDNSLGSDEVDEGSFRFPAVRLKGPSGSSSPCTDSQTVPHNEQTAIVFLYEDYDTGGFHGSGCETETTRRIFAPRPGIYDLSAGLVWAAHGQGKRYIGLRVNGAGYVAAAEQDANANSATIQNVSTSVKLAEGDYVELVGMQTSGGDLVAPYDGRSFLAATFESAP